MGISLSNSILSFSGGSISITICTSQSSGANIINFRAGCTLTLTVTYAEPVGVSTGAVGGSSVPVGGTIQFYVYATMPSNVYHKLTWVLGSSSLEYTLVSGTTSYLFTAPVAWYNQMSGTTGTGRVTLATYNLSHTFLGYNVYTFTVTLPEGTAPTIGSFTAARIAGQAPAAWPVYAQGLSQAKLTIGSPAATQGSIISRYKITGGGYSFSHAGTATYTTGLLTSAGAVTFTGTVTDARGLSSSKTVTIQVEPYAAPKILLVSAFRCLATGVASETGAYLSVKVDSAYSTVAGHNSYQIIVKHRKVGVTAWTDGAGGIASGEVKVINAGFTGADLYEIQVTIQDQVQSSVRVCDVVAAQYTMHFAKGGKNVSIGKIGTRQGALEVDATWKIFHGDTDVMAQLTGIIPVTRGGTGATVPATALRNLGIIYAGTAPASPVTGMIWLKPA